MSKKIQKFFASVSLALMMAALVIIVGMAAAYEYTEGNLFWISGPDTPSALINGGCRGGQCKYLVQDNTNPSAWRWTNDGHAIDDWYAYDPTIGEAAVRYGVRENSGPSWTQVVNQANALNKGTFVWLGFSDGDLEGGFIMLHNGCVAGYWCGGLDVYWDNVKYVE